MDVERNLISRVLLDRAIIPVVEARVTNEWFENPDSSRVWSWLINYWQEYGAIPTASALKNEFPTYRLVKTAEPLAYLVDELRARRRFALLSEGLYGALDHLQNKAVDDSLREIMGSISQLSVETAADVDSNLIETWEDRMTLYEELKKLPGGMRGIPMGVPSLDRALSGMQDGQLVTLVGLPKAGKSTLALKMAVNAHEYGKSPLFVGFEMSNQEQEARHDAMIGHTDHRRLMNGQLSDSEMEKLMQALKRRKSMHPFWLSSDITSSQTVSGLAGKIEQYRPDILVVDGVYMMIDEITGEQNTPQSLTNITRSLKRLAQRFRIPILITTQALAWKVSKKIGLTADSIGYTSSFAQDSDVIIGVESVEGADDLKKVSVVIARNAPRMAVMLRWDWDTAEFEEESETETGDGPSESEKLAERMGYAD